MYMVINNIGGIMNCITCMEELDQELGCVNCFCIQYWNLNDSSIPSDIKHLRIEK